MANWAWPHTPSSSFARLLLIGGPFDGQEAGFLPPNVAAPDQIAWSGWFPWGFRCYPYTRAGQRMERGRVAAITYAFLPGQLAEVPPAVSEDADLYEAASETLMRWLGFPGIPGAPGGYIAGGRSAVIGD